MADLFQTPVTELDANEHVRTMRTLKKQQSMIGGMVGAVMGAVPAIVFLFWGARGVFPAMVWVLPGFIAGLFIKFCGRPFGMWHRFVPAIVAGGLVGSVFYFIGANPFMYLYSFLNVLCALAVSRRKMNPEQEKALYMYRLGRLKM